MSSPAPCAKGRRSRKQTLGSENTETTLSSSAAPQSASVARAVADVGDRRYRFSSRSDRRVNTTWAMRCSRSLSPARSGRRRPARSKHNLVVETLPHLRLLPLCGATHDLLYFIRDLIDRHAIVGGYSDDGLELERRHELPLLAVLRP